VANTSPLYVYVLEGRCTDHPTNGKFCTQQLCNAVRSGKKEDNQKLSKKFCEETGLCVPLLGVGALDWAISNCMETCDCKVENDPFNPRENTGTGKTWKCEEEESCDFMKKRGSVPWSYVKYPHWIELHVGTGVFIMFFAPLQFVKGIRMWRDKQFHRWNGRFMVLLFVPNMIGSLGAAIVGIFDSDVGIHLYTHLFRSFLGSAGILSIVFFVCSIYFVKKKDIPRHGEFMMRSMAMWFGIPIFRMLSPFFEFFVGSRWTFPASGFFCFAIPLIMTEVYIRKSNRFVQPAWEEGKADNFNEQDMIEATSVVL